MFIDSRKMPGIEKTSFFIKGSSFSKWSSPIAVGGQQLISIDASWMTIDDYLKNKFWIKFSLFKKMVESIIQN